ncbi:TylF/MycF/NovP-related O-methyltransferase [Burkholderia gladioli pv. gladioli]|uniref:TylF/MycF/NovP-related O-methyltransferase n=1 Tax=Burkholderia gladioli TaxID=28095 RepID=UPI0024BC3E6F|nr:TylF/MycF/NovP-related O-methyltransferase [Burkholderia gladioli]MDJ1162965.1 TylF/MycF/NovP-related O-methyltransferase [Burkholderia gladioli pv. gladioli]
MYNHLYIDLLKKILRNSIYEGNATSLAPTADDIRECETFITEIEQEAPHVLSVYPYLTPEKLAEIFATTKVAREIHTYVGQRGLDNVEECAHAIMSDQIPGDFLDAGVLRGGIGILMRGILKSAQDPEERMVIMADSFEGLPPPSDADSIFDREVWYRFAEKTNRYTLKCFCDLDVVKGNFSKYDLLDDKVEFIKGWFNETMPLLRSRVFSLIRIDVDWYESCRDILDNIYDSLSDGGFVIVDDYKLQGCRSAIDTFRQERGIKEPIHVADSDSGIVFWRKAS